MRLADVIARAGRPEHHLTWSEPLKDPPLRKAEKAGRVMTVHQQMRGAKKDFGVVGLEAGPNAQYYVFPRSLRRFKGARVVAINYEALGERMTVSAPAAAPRATAKKRREKVIPFPGKPATRAAEARPAAPPPERPKPAPPSLADVERAVSSTLRDLRARRTGRAIERLAELRDALRR